MVSLDTVIAANRFGLGARPGELAEIGADPRGWLALQAAGSRPVPGPIAELPGSAVLFETLRQAQRQRRQSPRDARTAAPSEKIRQRQVARYFDQVAARYRVAVETRESFRERLVDFWSNHFAVSADKATVLTLAATLENEVIRPNLAGSFADLLLAVATHPAMILYLDNQASIGPGSPLARRATRRPQNNGRKLGINENLAREILELHTLGVNGGYSQADVTAFAQVLTGWSIGADQGSGAKGRPGAFEFRERAHEPGAKVVLGKRYAEDGAGQGRAVLKDIARHSATAQHLATKLARHFIADEPPPGAVERIARAFRDSEGDLPAVHKALIELPEAWRATSAKFKTPHEFVVSALRAAAFVPAKARQLVASFQVLGQRPYTPGSPAGWPDTAAQWDGPDALFKRIEWAAQIGDRLGSRVRPLQLAEDALGPSLSDATRMAVARASSAAQGITLLFASPQFMRR